MNCLLRARAWGGWGTRRHFLENTFEFNKNGIRTIRFLYLSPCKHISLGTEYKGRFQKRPCGFGSGGEVNGPMRNVKIAAGNIYQ